MVTYSDITTALAAGWNGAVIAEPSYYKENLYKGTRYGLYVKVLDGRLQSVSAANKAFRRVTKIFLKVVAKNLSDLEKYRSEIIRILTQWNVSGGSVGIVDAQDPVETFSRYAQTLVFEEKVYRSYDNL